jgi:hypothetical protein
VRDVRQARLVNQGSWWVERSVLFHRKHDLYNMYSFVRRFVFYPSLVRIATSTQARDPPLSCSARCVLAPAAVAAGRTSLPLLRLRATGTC